MGQRASTYDLRRKFSVKNCLKRVGGVGKDSPVLPVRRDAMVKPQGIRNTFQPRVMHEEDLEIYRSCYATNLIAPVIFKMSLCSVPSSRSAKYQYYFNIFNI
jgi:hypothetical protein